MSGFELEDLHYLAKHTCMNQNLRMRNCPPVPAFNSRWGSGAACPVWGKRWIALLQREWNLPTYYMSSESKKRDRLQKSQTYPWISFQTFVLSSFASVWPVVEKTTTCHLVGQKFCEEYPENGELWPATPDGDTVINRTCEPGRVGYKERTCENGQWQPVFSSCVDEQLAKVLDAAEVCVTLHLVHISWR